MLIQCDVKGCRKESEALLDPQTEQVFCAECGNVIESVNHFTKVTLRTLGQIKRAQSPNRAFSVQCGGCGQTNLPKLKGKELVCPKCQKPHQLNKVMETTVRQYILENPAK